MESYNSMDLAAFRGVWVVCETEEGKVAAASLELLSEGRKLADDLKTELGALLPGDQVKHLAQNLGGYGADRVVVVDTPALSSYNTEGFTSAVCQFVLSERPEILLFSATTTGRDLAPRCAARLHTGLCADCTHLHVQKKSYLEFLAQQSALAAEKMEDKTDERSLKMTMPAFGGHLMATIVCPRFRPQMATVRPGVMKTAAYDEKKAEQCRIEYAGFSVQQDERIEVIGHKARKKSAVDLEHAEVVVAVGRGIGDCVERGLALAEQLAAAMGGVVGATRDAVNAGWLTEDRMIGQTGKIVRPRIYFALGISGAIQHKCGMQDSDCIIAVNSDPHAPIFEIADYCLVGDLFEIVPEIIESLRATH